MIEGIFVARPVATRIAVEVEDEMNEATGRSQEQNSTPGARGKGRESGLAPTAELRPFPNARVAREQRSAADASIGVRVAALGRRSSLVGLAVLLLIGAASVWLKHYLAVGRYIYSTDDAYIRNDLATVSPKISGYVEKIEVVDNQHVDAGQILARIDAGDYDLALAAARQKVRTQDAVISRIRAQIAAQDAVVAQAEAQLDSGRVELARAEADLTRIKELAAADFATRQRFEQSTADRDKAVAAVAGHRAVLAGARANLLVMRAETVQAEHVRVELAIAAQRAERDLSFALVRAPFAGTIGNRVVELGQFVQPGARLMALAPDNRCYVEANFKETQLDRLAPGQKVAVRIDAYDGKTFNGVVESIAPASGANYALLPPENATGNFTKITQRFPVRIRIAGLDGAPLRAGLSVEVDVDTRAQRKSR